MAAQTAPTKTPPTKTEPQEYEIELIYNEKGAGVADAGYKGVAVTTYNKGDEPATELPQLKVGDTLVFKSSYPLNIELTPKSLFWPTNLFSTDDTFCNQHNIYPGRKITVIDAGHYKCCCGFVTNDKTTGKPITYGYPASRDLGVEDTGP